MFLSLTIFFSVLVSLILVRKHLFNLLYLLSLLSLEFLLLSVYFIMYFFNFFFHDFFFIICFLVMGVCDGVMGLSLIVYLVRSFSLDYIDSLVLF